MARRKQITVVITQIAGRLCGLVRALLWIFAVAEGQADTARLGGGGSKITAMRLFPHRGHRNRLSMRDRGNARPRVHTNVSISNSFRNRHSLLDLDAGPSSRPRTHLATIRQPSENASPIVSTMRTNHEHNSAAKSSAATSTGCQETAAENSVEARRESGVRARW